MSEVTTAKQPETIIGSVPDARGHFGVYGGKFVSETLMVPLEELRIAYEQYSQDPEFIKELDDDLRQYVGRPSP